LDQSATFLKATEIVMAEVARLESEAMEEARRG